MYERALASAMMGIIDRETALNLVSLHDAVCTKIFCDCGKVMDSRKSVLVQMNKGTAICCGPCWDRVEKKLEPEYLKTITATDARLYKTDGTLKPKPKTKRLPSPSKKAFVRLEDNTLEEVAFSRKIEIDGRTWFIHGKRKDWSISHWESGVKARWAETQKEAIALFSEVTPKQWKEADKQIKQIVKKFGKANN